MSRLDQNRRGGSVAVAFPLAAAMVVFALPATSQSEEVNQRAEARRHYQRAMELADERAFAEAVVEFKRAYELAPHHTVLYNLGQAFVALNKPVEAVDTLKQYLEEGANQIEALRRAEVEAVIRREEGRIGALMIASDPEGVEVRIDGRDVGRTPLKDPVRLAIGVHQVTGTLDGHERTEQMVTLAGEERKKIVLALRKVAPVTAPSIQLHSLDDPGRSQRLTGYAVGGLGLATGVAALVHFFWNKDRHERWQAEDAKLGADPRPPDFVERQIMNDDLADSIRRASVVTVALAVGSGVLAAVGTVLVATAPGKSPVEAPGSGFSLGPSAIAWWVRW
jgi:hypothetical protein